MKYLGIKTLYDKKGDATECKMCIFKELTEGKLPFMESPINAGNTFYTVYLQGL